MTADVALRPTPAPRSTQRFRRHVGRVLHTARKLTMHGLSGLVEPPATSTQRPDGKHACADGGRASLACVDRQQSAKPCRWCMQGETCSEPGKPRRGFVSEYTLSYQPRLAPSVHRPSSDGLADDDEYEGLF